MRTRCQCLGHSPCRTLLLILEIFQFLLYLAKMLLLVLYLFGQLSVRLRCGSYRMRRKNARLWHGRLCDDVWDLWRIKLYTGRLFLGCKLVICGCGGFDSGGKSD